ncbi:MAG TPA: FAD-dependent oxidoreductase, partial [Saprospiraceae bacterium]|nr:FAD-dependent oxidoreductase [Saprospiraceae bacterium]
MIETEILIVGQGLAGSSLAIALEHRGKNDFIVLDNDHETSSSMAAAGTINPVTGRQYVKSWIYEDLRPIFLHTYQTVNSLHHQDFFRNLPIIRTLRSIKEENMWLSRMEDEQYRRYLDFQKRNEELAPWIQPPQSFGEVKDAYQLNLRQLLPFLRNIWESENKFIVDKFDYEALIIQPQKLIYKDIKAKMIVFCEGHQVLHNPYFNQLPFDPVKGEALIIHLQEGFTKSVRDKIFITPIGNDLYWCGANYE